MIKVAILIPRIVQLGPIRVIQAMVNCLSESEGIDIKVFYLDKKIDPDVKMKVPVVRYSTASFIFGEFDIVHTNGLRPDLIGFINRRKIKYHISTIHNLVFEDLKYTYNTLISVIFGTLWLRLWRSADKLVCISQTMEKYYFSWFSLSKMTVIHNGISGPVDFFKPDYDVIEALDLFRSRGLKILGFVGILTKRKGADQLLNLLTVEKDNALVLIGDGRELKLLIRMAEKLKITERVFFAGFRSNAVNYIKHFDLFIMPSRSEGFGLAMIEAVQQKIPVICSDIAVFKELFQEDEVTFFKTDDAVSLSEAFKTSIETGFKKAETAFASYKNNYTDVLMSKHYYELYRSA